MNPAEALHVGDAIESAQTIASSFYLDPVAFELQKEKVFERLWQFVGDADLVKTPGAVYPFTLLEGFLDEPLLLTRDMSDKVHCISNVCTHRANLVCEHAGQERFLRCRYHGRRFGLDGQFQHMPEFDKVEGFPSERDNLPAVPFGSWSKLLFASVNPICSLEEYLAPVKERVGWLPLHEFRFDAARSRDYLVRAHWALYCDNYLEGFHIPFIHPELNEVLDYSQYRDELLPYGTLQFAVAKGAEDVFDLPAGHPDSGQRVSAYYYWMFPNLMLNFYPWGLSVNVVRPVAPDLTRVSFLCYVWREERLGKGAGAALDRVEREDEVVVESVQRGLRSKFYDRGRFSVDREKGVHHFHKLLSGFMGRE